MVIAVGSNYKECERIDGDGASNGASYQRHMAPARPSYLLCCRHCTSSHSLSSPTARNVRQLSRAAAGINSMDGTTAMDNGVGRRTDGQTAVKRGRVCFMMCGVHSRDTAQSLSSSDAVVAIASFSQQTATAGPQFIVLVPHLIILSRYLVIY